MARGEDGDGSEGGYRARGGIDPSVRRGQSPPDAVGGGTLADRIRDRARTHREAETHQPVPLGEGRQTGPDEGRVRHLRTERGFVQAVCSALRERVEEGP